MTQQAASVGLTYHMDRVIPANSFDAHRLVHFASGHGKMKEMTELLFRAHFTDGENLGDKNRLADLAAEVGLDRNLAAALESDDFQSEVRADEAYRKFGNSGSAILRAGRQIRRVRCAPLKCSRTL